MKMSGENGPVLTAQRGKCELRGPADERWEENSVTCGAKGERTDSVLTSK